MGFFEQVQRRADVFLGNAEGDTALAVEPGPRLLAGIGVADRRYLTEAHVVA